MRKVNQTNDMSGRKVRKGDTVVTMTGNVTAKVCDIAVESDSTAFVCLRAVHRPFSRGIWHAADQVVWVASARPKKPAVAKVVVSKVAVAAAK